MLLLGGLFLHLQDLLELLLSLVGRNHVDTRVHEFRVGTALLEVLGQLEVFVEVQGLSDLIRHHPRTLLVEIFRNYDMIVFVKLGTIIAVINLTIEEHIVLQLMVVLSLVQHVVIDGSREVLLAGPVTPRLLNHLHRFLVETLDTANATIVELRGIHLHLLVARDGSPVVRQILVEEFFVILLFFSFNLLLFGLTARAKLAKTKNDIDEDAAAPNEEAEESQVRLIDTEVELDELVLRISWSVNEL